MLNYRRVFLSSLQRFLHIDLAEATRGGLRHGTGAAEDPTAGGAQDVRPKESRGGHGVVN